MIQYPRPFAGAAALLAAAVLGVTVHRSSTSPAVVAAAEPPPAAGPKAPDHASLQAFLNTYCTKCHGAEKQKGDRRFDRLKLPVTDADSLVLLQDVIDQINLGDMPPRTARQPSAAERKAIVEGFTRAAADGRSHVTSTGGQAVLRRLNRREYLNTVGDLFAMNMTLFDPTAKFPRDETVERLDNVGDTLKVSGYLLHQYVDAATQVVEKALPSQPRPAEQTWRFAGDFQQQPELRAHGDAFKFRYLCVYETVASNKHEGAYGPVHGFEQGVPADGYYEIKVKAEGKNRRHPYNPAIFGTDPDDPLRMGIVAGNARFGPLYQPQRIEPTLGEAVLKDEQPEWFTFTVWLDAGFTPRITVPNGIKSVRNCYSRILRDYGDQFPRKAAAAQGIAAQRRAVLTFGKVPHVRVHEVVIRGPLGGAPLASQAAVLGDKPFEPGRTRAILEAFANKAYRRPVLPDELERLMALVERRRQDGRTPFEALKDALTAVLCSPAFLYLSEPAPAGGDTRGKPLAAYDLASRLSYFLWSSLPDDELFRLAKSGEILKSDVLAAQTRRMLASPKSEAFVAGFLDSWLNLRSLGDMPPDRGAFERYYTQGLQDAMRRETHLFARHLIDADESVVRFLDADYTFVNRALARHYGMAAAVPAEGGHAFRRVTVSDPNRGGLLGHGSVLTVTANGVETSPVTRGVWLLETILGTPPPPPPDNVPAIDPDVRGAKSIRDLLARHRQSPACFECHRKIDPLGFALENFDPVGAWRTRYENGTPIDPSGELPNGRAFKDLAGLKKVLVERKGQFAHALTEKLMAYACGRRMEPADRPAVSGVVAELERGGDGFQRLIERVVLSETFRSK